MKDVSKLRVAIVHDWLVGGGAEQVVLALHQLFPEAPIYTSYCSPEWRRKLDNKVVTGWLQHFPTFRKFLVLGRIWWFSRLDLSGYDVVISSSGNGEAKGVKVPKDTVHICYCHSPTHYYWRHYNQYLAHPGFGIFNPLARLGLRLFVGPLRKWDKLAAERPQYWIANSNHIKDDIKRYYDRDAAVIHPPVDIKQFIVKEPEKRNGFVTMGRQVPYKRTDIVIEACNKLSLPLTVIGRGPDHSRLVKLAGPTIQLLTNVEDSERSKFLAGAEAFIFSAFEDFGITPIEAMATGTPVIAYKAGGVLDYVNDTTGKFFEKQTVDSLTKVLQEFKASKFDHQAITKNAQGFDVSVFKEKFLAFLQDCLSR